MAFHRVISLAGISQRRSGGPRPGVGWVKAEFAWAVTTFLVMAAAGVLFRAEAQESDGAKIPIVVIRFDRGASGKDIPGAVVRPGRSIYSIDARSGQQLSLSISSVEDNAVFQVYPPGARAAPRDYGVEIVGVKPLPGAGEGEDAKKWSGILPVTGTYLVVVGPTRGNATYTLSVAIR
jgi:hypothetical protein